MTAPYLTMAEIEARYPNQWVLVDQLMKNHDGMAVGGTVVAHSSEREAVYRIARSLPTPRDIAIFYTGAIPDDVIFIL